MSATKQPGSGRPQTGEFADYAKADIDYVKGDNAVAALTAQLEDTLELAHLLGQFLPDLLDVFPVEPHSGGFVLQALGTDEGWQLAGNPIEDGSGRRGRLLLALDFLPVLQGFFGG